MVKTIIQPAIMMTAIAVWKKQAVFTVKEMNVFVMKLNIRTAEILVGFKKICC